MEPICPAVGILLGGEVWLLMCGSSCCGCGSFSSLGCGDRLTPRGKVLDRTGTFGTALIRDGLLVTSAETAEEDVCMGIVLNPEDGTVVVLVFGAGGTILARDGTGGGGVDMSVDKRPTHICFTGGNVVGGGGDDVVGTTVSSSSMEAVIESIDDGASNNAATDFGIAAVNGRGFRTLIVDLGFIHFPAQLTRDDFKLSRLVGSRLDSYTVSNWGRNNDRC